MGNLFRLETDRFITKGTSRTEAGQNEIIQKLFKYMEMLGVQKEEVYLILTKQYVVGHCELDELKIKRNKKYTKTIEQIKGQIKNPPNILKD